MGNMSTFVFGTATKTLMNYLHKSDKKAAQIKKSENSKLMKKVLKSATSQYLKKVSQNKSRQSVQKKKPISYVQKKEQPWYKKVIESSNDKVSSVKNSALNTWNKAWNGTKNIASASKDWGVNTWNKAWNGTKNIASASKDWGVNTWNKAWNGTKNIASASKDWGVNTWNKTWNGTKNIASASKDWGVNTWNKTWNGTKNIASASKNWGVNTWNKAWNGTKEKYNLYAPKAVQAWHDTTKWMEPIFDGSSYAQKLADIGEKIKKGSSIVNSFDYDEKLQFTKFTEKLSKISGYTKLKATDFWRTVKPYIDTGVGGFKTAYNSSTGRAIRNYGGRVLKIVDLVSPMYKILQAKTPREGVEIAVEEYLPKAAGIATAFVIGDVGAIVAGLSGQAEVLPFLPVASFLGAEAADTATKAIIDKTQFQKTVGNWIFGDPNKTSNGQNTSISNKNPIKKNISTSTKSAQRVTTSKNNGSNHKGNPIYVNIPTGTVQISHNNHSSVDAAVIASQVGQMIATQFKRAVENQKPIHS